MISVQGIDLSRFRNSGESQTAEIIQLSFRLGSETAKRAAVVPVDYVVGENFDKEIEKRFDLIIANHVVEHIPNMIGWFDRLSNLLNSNGHVFLSVPDRNYTFDIIRDLTITRELIDNFVLNRKQPSASSVLDANYFRRNISTGSDVWSGKSKKIVKIPSKIDARSFLEAVKNRIYRGDYIDTHCNVFTEKSFKSILRNLEDMGFGNLRLERTYPVQYPYNEFYALLKKY